MCAVAEAEMRQKNQLEQKDMAVSSLKSQLEGAQRQHNVQLMQLQIDVYLYTQAVVTCDMKFF